MSISSRSLVLFVPKRSRIKDSVKGSKLQLCAYLLRSRRKCFHLMLFLLSRTLKNLILLLMAIFSELLYKGRIFLLAFALLKRKIVE